MSVTLTTRAGKGSALTHAELDANFTAINAALMPVGTLALFIQAAAPSGWTQDNTYNDRVLRVIDNTGTGATTSGSWTISGFNADSHVLTIDEIPAHTHNIKSYDEVTGGNYLSAGVDNTPAKPDVVTQSTGGGLGHTHTVSNDGNWRPAYVDAIVCSKD